MADDKNYEIFSKNSLFSGLGADSLKALYSISEEYSLKKGDFLMKEGDEALEIFFILDGDLDIIKYDEQSKTNFVVNILHGGDTVGEQALIDKGRRSASIRAATDVRLLKIPFTGLEKLSNQYKDFAQVNAEISRRMSKKLRETTDVAFGALKKELEGYKHRVAMGQFLVYVITVISLFVYTVRPLKYALQHVSDTTYVSIPFIIVLTGFVVLIIRACPFPLSDFGFTTKLWKKSVVEGILFTIPVMASVIVIKWVSILYNPEYAGHDIFEPFALMQTKTLSYWITNSLFYCLFVPIQEIMARGALQGPMEKFLTGKWKVFTSIVISNFIFSSAHVFLSEEIAVLVLLSGLYFGWLYSRTYNLMGVIIAHCMLGVWGLNVIGPKLG